MARRSGALTWASGFERQWQALAQTTMRAGRRAAARAVLPVVERRRPPPGGGISSSGVVLGAAGARRYKLFRPADMEFGERLPLMVMLHGCGQDARSFAMSTRMNRVAAQGRFLVLYPEQDRLANAQGCWNWFDTSAGRAYGEVALIMRAIDQVCMFYAGDRGRVAIAGMSAGASMAALLVTRHPKRFKAVVMHSGIPPGTAHSTMSALSAMHGHRATRPLTAAPSIMETWPPLMVIHGGVDDVVSISNGHAAVEAWATAAGARALKPRLVQRGGRYPATVSDFEYQGRCVATLVEVGRLAHAWSGGAAGQPHSDVRGPDASRMAWAFAAKQFRAPGSS
jgi:poly(hydroxyalkanoate) depolymerase family esterase